MVIAGDFDVAETTDLVTRYFGRIPAGAGKVPRDIATEPVQTTEKRVMLEEAWPLPAVIVAHHITYDGHPDSYPMHVLAKVLSDGNSSRIYRSLVYDKRLAVAAFGSANLIEHPNLFFAVAHRRRPASRSRRWRRRSSPNSTRPRPTASPTASCSAPRTSSRATTSWAARRCSRRRGVLAHAEVLHADLTTADGEFAIFQNMTRADVQRVAKTYFTPESRVVLHVRPKSAGTRP